MTSKPKLSVLVVVYRMPRQAMNTLYSLSDRYQLQARPEDYEVLIMENISDQNLVRSEVEALGRNFHYVLRHETRPTPVFAVNEGVARCRGDHVCIMIDGARMVSPGLIWNTLALIGAVPDSLICAPGYHLGKEDQKYHLSSGYSEAVEQELLDRIDWKSDGYRLFGISCFSNANSHGIFHPLMESNCMTCRKRTFLETGGAHEGFQTPGGGSVNLDMYRNLAMIPKNQLFILAGEGSFHQFHGGITTSEVADLEEVLASHRAEYKAINGQYYEAALREPVIYGQIPKQAHPFIQHSAQRAIKRFKRFSNQGHNPWRHDPEEKPFTRQILDSQE